MGWDPRGGPEHDKTKEFVARIALTQWAPGGNNPAHVKKVVRSIYEGMGAEVTFRYPLRVLMQKTYVQAGIARVRAVAAEVLREKYQMEQSEILERLERHARAELPNLFNDDLTMKPISQWGPNERAAMAAIEVCETGGPEMTRTVVKKFKLSSAQAALITLAEIKGMKTTKATVTHEFASLSDEELVRRAADALGGSPPAEG